MRLLIFGTGLYYQKRKDAFSGDEIIAFVDNNSNKYGTFIGDIPVISPDEIYFKEYDYICLMAKGEFVEQMRGQLEELRIPYEKIVDFFEYKLLCEGARLEFYYGRKCTVKSAHKILLLTHELSYSGAPLVLFYMGRILRKRGYSVTVLSLKDGELRRDFVDEGIVVGIQEEDNRRFDPFLYDWMQQFDLVWGNTVTYYYWIGPFSRSTTPFIWWLHESAEAYEWLGKERMPKETASNIHVYAVGSLALNMAQKYIPCVQTESLLYGIPDFKNHLDIATDKKGGSKIVFAMIGTICSRKAQDIFLKAIELLTEEERKKSEFWIIGSILNQEFYNKIRSYIEQISEVKILGPYNRDEIKQIYMKVDVVVCPSREDPMPVVATEAMIVGKPSIVSEMTGTAALITDKENGFIVKTEDSQSLAEKMGWIIEHKEEIGNIGFRARRLYEETFSMEVFESNVCGLIGEILNIREDK